MPSFGDNAQKKRLPTIPGVVPDLMHLPQGCRFQERCDRVEDVCREKEPVLTELAGDRSVSCHVAVREKGAASA